MSSELVIQELHCCAAGFSCARAEPKTPTRRAAPPKMPTITGGAEIVEFYDRNERAFARRGAGE